VPHLLAAFLLAQGAGPFEGPEARATVLLFVDPECPVSNRYAPEIAALNERFAPRGVAFHIVYPNAEAPAARAHAALFKLPGGVLADTDRRWTREAGATVTPEAAVYAGRRLIYRGRIDDRHVRLGETRPAPSKQDLAAALERALSPNPGRLRTTKAVGCYIPRRSGSR